MSAGPPRYPDRLEIVPLDRPPEATVRVPGSKSITNRALVLAALAAANEPINTVELYGVLRSEDTEVMVAALRALGWKINGDWERARIEVKHPGGDRLIPASETDLQVAN